MRFFSLASKAGVLNDILTSCLLRWMRGLPVVAGLALVTRSWLPQLRGPCRGQAQQEKLSKSFQELNVVAWQQWQIGKGASMSVLSPQQLFLATGHVGGYALKQLHDPDTAEPGSNS